VGAASSGTPVGRPLRTVVPTPATCDTPPMVDALRIGIMGAVEAGRAGSMTPIAGLAETLRLRAEAGRDRHLPT
jgi:hypothetical protein